MTPKVNTVNRLTLLSRLEAAQVCFDDRIKNYLTGEPPVPDCPWHVHYQCPDRDRCDRVGFRPIKGMVPYVVRERLLAVRGV